MINSFDELNKYPECPGQEIIDGFVEFVIKDSINKPIHETLEKLEILSDKQYHEYGEPSSEIKNKIQNWIIANWIMNTISFLESIMIIFRNFSMNKEIYSKALEIYKGKGDSFHEFELDLINSTGENINPWWDMKK